MKLYCGTYKKYNEGSLFGKWMDLDDYADKDEFLEACAELHKDEKYPEFMFQDMEYEYEWENKLYSECSVPEEYWEIKNELEKEGIDNECYDAWLTNIPEDPCADHIKRVRDDYLGKYDSEEEFAESYFEEDPIHKSCLANYIDWDRVYEEEFRYNGYWNDNDYFFYGN